MEPSIAERLTDYFRSAAPRGVVSVYLFGSHAEGRSHRESDVDIAVLLDRELFPSSRERFEERLRLIAELAASLHRNDVDLVILNESPPELGARIVTVGHRVFCSDPEKDHAFVRDIQNRAADLRPFLERMRRIKLEALKR